MTEKEPQFIREFSKEESADERTETARQIKAKRKEFFDREKSVGENESRMSAQLQEIEALKEQIEELSQSGLGKILNYFELRKLRAEVGAGSEKYGELQKKSDELEVEKKFGNELSEARGMLNEFWKNQKEKWSKSDYKKADIKKYFSEDYLASLSLKDYEFLLQRFPGEMVAHVTRQGIRDHTGMVYHTGGINEYATGFMKMVEDGRLRSPLGVQLVEKEKNKAFENYLGLDSFSTREEALEYLKNITDLGSQGDPGSYVDKSAVHFATEEVADGFYGSEKGNEIFVAYPSAYIASQYYFSGQLKNAGGDYWNDQWVWANEEKGMDLNAGVIFIPANAKVDKNSGSRYELDENQKPVINQEYKDLIFGFINSNRFQEFVESFKKAVDECRGIGDYRDYEIEMSKRKKEMGNILSRNFSIKDKRLHDAILSYRFFTRIEIAQEFEKTKGYKDRLNTIDSEVEEALRQEGILFVEAKDTVSSRDFWENYFNKRPNKKPSKIVYYEGDDPTQALRLWRPSAKRSKDEAIGFVERKVARNSTEATAGMSRFKSIATEVIEEYYGRNIDKA